MVQHEMASLSRTDAATFAARVGDSHTHRYGSYLLDLTRKSHYAKTGSEPGGGHVPGRTREERESVRPSALARRRDAARWAGRRMERDEHEGEWEG